MAVHEHQARRNTRWENGKGGSWLAWACPTIVTSLYGKYGGIKGGSARKITPDMVYPNAKEQQKIAIPLTNNAPNKRTARGKGPKNTSLRPQE